MFLEFHEFETKYLVGVYKRLSLKGGTGNRGIGERGIGERGISGNIGESLKGGISGNL